MQQRASTSDWIKQNKESVREKTVHLKLSCQRIAKKKIKKNEKSKEYYELWNTIKKNNPYIIKFQKKRKGKGVGKRLLKK